MNTREGHKIGRKIGSVLALISMFVFGPAWAGTLSVVGSSPATTSSPQYPVHKVSLPVPSAPRAFSSTTRIVPVVMVQRLSATQTAQGFYRASSGDATLVQVSVQYLESGQGPVVTTDTHFSSAAREALIDAVYVTGRALRYDIRFLRVHLSMPAGVRGASLIDGTSAGVAYAVAVASAILGDPMRPSVCLTGTVADSLQVGPVLGIEDKIDGCHYLRLEEFILPAGQTTLDISNRANGYSMRLTEAFTLGDAYAAATGQPLRSR